MPREPLEWVRTVAERLELELAPGEAQDLAARYLAAGLPGAPYPEVVPDHLASAYAQRDLGPESHRRAYVALLRTVEAPSDGFADALYEEITEARHWVPYPEAGAVVRELAAAGIRTGLVSNVGFDLRPILRAHGFAVLAECCTLSFEHGVAKPDRALFEAALATLGASAQETLMVGDHPAADAGATVLGCPTLLLPMSPPGRHHGLDLLLRLVRGDVRSHA